MRLAARTGRVGTTWFPREARGRCGLEVICPPTCRAFTEFRRATVRRGDRNLVAYTALGIISLLFWRRRRDAASMWAAATFGSLGLIVVLGLVPNHPGNLAERALVRIEIAILVLFPYLLFRFTTAFRRAGRRFANALFSLTAILVLWTFALPRIPQSGEPRPTFFTVYVVVFMIHWTLLSIVSARRLWRAGRGQPTVSRRRMHLLAIASAGLIVALLLAAFTSRQYSAWSLASGVLGFLSAAAFLLGFSPPAVVRLWWRAPETARVQEAIAGLLAFAESQEEVASRVLEPAAAIVGARAIAIRNADGTVDRRLERARRCVEEQGVAPTRRGTGRDRRTRRQPRRVDVAVCTVLRRRRARTAAHARRAHRPRARPRQPLPGRARSEARARARERGEVELRRAGRT